MRPKNGTRETGKTLVEEERVDGVSAVLQTAGGLWLLAVGVAWAVALVRPPQSPRAQRWLALPWATANLPPYQRRRKQALLAAGISVYGVVMVLQGLLNVSEYHNHVLAWMLVLGMAAALGCMVASFVIADRIP